MVMASGSGGGGGGGRGGGPVYRGLAPRKASHRETLGESAGRENVLARTCWLGGRVSEFARSYNFASSRGKWVENRIRY